MAPAQHDIFKIAIAFHRHGIQRDAVMPKAFSFSI
jgi:hypothetical protein